MSMVVAPGWDLILAVIVLEILVPVIFLIIELLTIKAFFIILLFYSSRLFPGLSWTIWSTFFLLLPLAVDSITTTICFFDSWLILLYLFTISSAFLAVTFCSISLLQYCSNFTSSLFWWSIVYIVRCFATVSSFSNWFSLW